MIRIAALGCGRIGVMHAANIAAHSRATLAGVCDIHAPAADAFARKTGAKVFSPVEAVLASAEVDAVRIAAMTDMHAGLPEMAALKSIAEGRVVAVKELH